MKYHRRRVAESRGYVIHKKSEVCGPLYHALLCAGLDAHMEVIVPSARHRSGMMRVDIGILTNYRLTAVIEVKREGQELPLPHSRQFLAYQSLCARGIAVHFINDPSKITALVTTIKEAA